MQQSTDSDSPDLYQICEDQVKALENECPKIQGKEPTDVVIDKIKMLMDQTESDAINMASSLQEEVRNNQVEIETRGRRIVIRVQEKRFVPIRICRA